MIVLTDVVDRRNVWINRQWVQSVEADVYDGRPATRIQLHGVAYLVDESVTVVVGKLANLD